MPNDTKARPPRQPEKKIGPFASGIGIAIWLNESHGEDGSPRQFRSITVNPRRYFDRESNQWKDATSYQQSDLPALIFAMQKALEYCYQTPVPGHEDGDLDPDAEGVGDRF